jgi:hypothetical protein
VEWRQAYSTGGRKGDLTDFQKAKGLPNIKLKIEKIMRLLRKFAFCNFRFSMKFSVPFQNAKLMLCPLFLSRDFWFQGGPFENGKIPSGLGPGIHRNRKGENHGRPGNGSPSGRAPFERPHDSISQGRNRLRRAEECEKAGPLPENRPHGPGMLCQ